MTTRHASLHFFKVKSNIIYNFFLNDLSDNKNYYIVIYTVCYICIYIRTIVYILVEGSLLILL